MLLLSGWGGRARATPPGSAPLAPKVGGLRTLRDEGPASPASAPTKPALVVVLPGDPQQGRLLAPIEAEVARSERYRLLPLPALLPLMRQADEAGQVRTRATALIEEGRQALVALDHTLAKSKLASALQVLEQSFVRHYDAHHLAEVHVHLGILALQGARPDLARQEFVDALHLAPTFKLDAHYSPQVRTAFAEAAQALPPRPAPSRGDLGRLLRLAGARAALVLSVGPAGDRALLQGAVFLQARGAYTGVESVLIDPAASPEAGGRSLGLQLRRAVEPLYPAPPRKLIARTITIPEQPKPRPPVRPWYRRWYTWAAAGGVVAAAAAIVLPLTLRKETVEVPVHWGRSP